MSAMAAGALTPEELDSLLEDAFVACDVAAVPDLFEAHALLASGGAANARGAGIAALVAGLWAHDVTYIPGARRVLQVNDTALIVTERATSVAHRNADARWRYTIALLDTNPKEIMP
jgi:hypothetical protein